MEETLRQRPFAGHKIVLYGPESTGKSTLSRQLTSHYGTTLIPEFARDYLQQLYDDTGLACRYEDLIPIAIGQRLQENNAIASGTDLLICDTDLLETAVYSQAYFNNVPGAIEQALENDAVSIYLLMDIDIPWVADDLRDRPQQRQVLFKLFKNTLVARGLPYILITGSRQCRFNTAINAIDTILKR